MLGAMNNTYTDEMDDSRPRTLTQRQPKNNPERMLPCQSVVLLAVTVFSVLLIISLPALLTSEQLGCKATGVCILLNAPFRHRCKAAALLLLAVSWLVSFIDGVVRSRHVRAARYGRVTTSEGGESMHGPGRSFGCAAPVLIVASGALLALPLLVTSKSPPSATTQSPEADSTAPANSTEALRPLRWLHVPKAGSSFQNTLLAWGCHPSRMPLSRDVGTVAQFLETNPVCSGSFAPGQPVASHHPLSASDRVARPGRVVGIFREPLKRIASGYAHNFHDCKPLQRRYKCSTSHSDFTCASRVPQRAEEATVLAYARCVEGCWRRMMCGQQCGRRALPPMRQHYRTAAAAAHVAAPTLVLARRVFAFVGHTGAWARSICVFVGLFAPRHTPAYADLADLLGNVRPSGKGRLRDRALRILRRNRVNDSDAPLHRWVVEWLKSAEKKLLVQNSSRYRECTELDRAIQHTRDGTNPQGSTTGGQKWPDAP